MATTQEDLDEMARRNQELRAQLAAVVTDTRANQNQLSLDITAAALDAEQQDLEEKIAQAEALRDADPTEALDAAKSQMIASVTAEMQAKIQEDANARFQAALDEHVKANPDAEVDAVAVAQAMFQSGSKGDENQPVQADVPPVVTPTPPSKPTPASPSPTASTSNDGEGDK